MATILVVDDLAPNREFLVALLGYRGHRLTEAADGVQALAAVRAERPDLVITDVLMPVMDGYELVRQLRLDPSTRTLPVVFYTAHYGEREARELALSSGVSHVLTKPSEPEEVLRVVDRVLSRGPGPAAAPDPATLGGGFDREHLRLLTDKLSENEADLRAANARLRALVNIGLELASERDGGRLLASVCAAARDLFGATYVTLGIVGRDDRRIQRLVADGAGAGEWIAPGDEVPGGLVDVVEGRRTVRGENPGGGPAALGLPAGHPPVHAWLAAPVASPAHVYGWICLVGNEGRAFAEDDEHLLLALSGQVGRIYENGYFYSVARERADALEREVAERERAEREFRALFAANPLPMWIYDLDSLRFLEVNEAAVRHYGYARDEFLAMTIRDIRPPEDVQALLAQVEGERAAWEDSGTWRHRVRSGRLIDVQIISHAISFGGTLAELVVAQDVTRQTIAEAERRQHAELLALDAAVGLALAGADSLVGALQQCAEALVAHLGAAFARIWTLDQGENVLVLRASAGLYTHLNGPHGRVQVGELKIGRIARDRRPHLTNAVLGDPEVGDQAWARREGMVSFAGHPLVVDGRVVGVMALFARHPLSDAVLGALGSVADHVALGIERHRGAEALRTAEERMRFALQNAGVGIWDMDYGSGTLRWSEILESHYGLEPGSFAGTFEAFIACVHPDDREQVQETLGKATRLGTDYSVQHRALWRDGTVRWLSGGGRILLDAQGQPGRGVGISQDVTENRLLEEQYRRAQKMEAVGRLAGGVAHDFNNLLTVILGYCELLLEELDPADPHRDSVAEVQKAGASAAGLTRQLLAFSRKEIIQPRLLDLNAVVADLQAMVGRLIGEDVKVVLALEPGLATVRADRGQVEQIVMNLAVNARDAMPRGGTLTIETANVELDEHYGATHPAVVPGPYVVLTVTDTGTGMTPEVQARLFEPFFTTKEVGSGTGLGLATVHGIITQSGGSVNAYSEPGRGTSLKVYFPRAGGADAEPNPPAPAPRPQAGTHTVLVVEDAEGLRALARRLLERQGYRVLAAENADQAQRLFAANPSIDVLLTDVVMPGSSGPELSACLRELRPELKVIYMSGYTEEAIVQRGVLVPGIAFLHKPFTSGTLGAKLREVLDR